MQTWTAKPSNDVVIEYARAFFAAVAAGELEKAEGMVTHGMGKQKNVLWLDIAYRGNASGYIAELQVVETDGTFALQHTAFRMA